MSWYSDRETFNEFDYPWCRNCPGGDSYNQCKRCSASHLADLDDEEGDDR